MLKSREMHLLHLRFRSVCVCVCVWYECVYSCYILESCVCVYHESVYSCKSDKLINSVFQCWRSLLPCHRPAQDTTIFQAAEHDTCARQAKLYQHASSMGGGSAKGNEDWGSPHQPFGDLQGSRKKKKAANHMPCGHQQEVSSKHSYCISEDNYFVCMCSRSLFTQCEETLHN